MAIIATNNGGGNFTPIDPGNFPARCYEMIQIGTVQEEIQGKKVLLHKVRLTWELPTETKVWKEGEEEKPSVISKEFTLSMSEKATLRKFLASWRSKDFTEEEAKAFDITVLLGKACMLNVIHKQSKDGSRTYAEISSVSTLPKGFTCPDQVNPSRILSFDNFDWGIFESLPDFLKNKIKSSEEFKLISSPHEPVAESSVEGEDDVPF